MEPQDKTRVAKKKVLPFKLSKEQQNKIIQRKLQKNQAVIYDTNKAKKYENMQNFYNNNFFGYGMFGNQTHYNPITEQDKIQANFNYGRNNVINLAATLATSGIGGSFKSLVPNVGKRATVGDLSVLEPYKIGQGAEAIVINNSPTTVAKISQMGRGEMLSRNAIPSSAKQTFAGYVRNGKLRMPTFIQKKLKISTDKTFPKYLKKLDKSFEKSGYKKVNDPYVSNRAYTNGNIVVDDIKPENVGTTIFGKPKLIDFNITPVDEWLDLGYTL